MKNFHILFLNIIISTFFLLPSFAFSNPCEWNGNCDFQTYRWSIYIQVYQSAYTPIVEDPERPCWAIFEPGTGVNDFRTGIYIQTYRWNGTSWYFVTGDKLGWVAYGTQEADDVISYLNARGVYEEINPNVDFPEGCTCSNLANDASVACGGSEYVSSYDTELCDYSCVTCDEVAIAATDTCSPFNLESFDCVQINESDGSISSLDIVSNCYSQGCNELISECNNLCGGYGSSSCETDDSGYVISNDCVCDECSLETQVWAESNCGGLKYLDFYDCDTQNGTCVTPDCQDLYNDCLNECDGKIDLFGCLDGVITTPCECEDGVNILPIDDVTNDSNLDAVNSDPLDTETESLQKITDNTKAQNDNISNLAALSAEGLNNVVDSIENQTDALLSLSETQNENDTLTSSDSMALLNKLSDSITGYGDSQIDEVKEEIISLETTVGLEESLFDGLLTDFTAIFASGECNDLDFYFESIDKTLSITCEVSEKWKTLLGFLFGVYAVMSIMDTMFRGIQPKGSPHAGLWE